RPPGRSWHGAADPRLPPAPAFPRPRHRGGSLVSVLIVGLSHRSAPIDVLEQVCVDPAGASSLTDRVHAGQHVEEALVISTCNRLEVVAEAGTFHGALAEVGDALCAVSGLTREELTPHLYVHHDERA